MRLLEVLLAAGAAAGAVLLLRRLAPVDRRPAEDVARKPRSTPVSLAGGPALLAALGLWELMGLPAVSPVPALGPFAGGGLAPLGQQAGLPWPALLFAFLLGLVDDLRGLGPLPKLTGQGLVAGLLILEWQPGAAACVLLVAAVLVGLNAWNVLDHADGMASLPAVVALGPAGPWGGLAGLLGFLPFNLLFRQRGGERAPVAYLGDSGSHLLGLLVLLSPLGPLAMVVPLLDLLRVASLRRSEGRPPWLGDRRHLGHRLEAAGLRPARAAAVGALLFLPSWFALLGPAGGWLLVAVLAQGGGFLVLLRLTPDPCWDPGAPPRACPRPPAVR